MTLPDLITLLENATGPDRELADDVLVACGWTKSLEPGPYYTTVWHGPNGECEWVPDHPNPLASIDAAMSLLPTDKYWMFAKGRISPDDPLYAIQIYAQYGAGSEPPLQEVEHNNREICLCIAALRSRLTPGGER